jgi:outer membrane immunogenic protein
VCASNFRSAHRDAVSAAVSFATFYGKRIKGNSVMQKSSMRFVAAAIGLAAGEASAADLPLGFPAAGPAYIAPRPLAFLWTGCYIGGNIGGAWANIDATIAGTGTISARPSGVAGGGQVGCDYQLGEWVFGIRDMFDATSLRSSTTLFPGSANSQTSWFDTLTAREGYLVQPNILAYVQGGAAWTNTRVTFFDGAGTQIGQVSNNQTGWTLGGGAEWMFAPHWSVYAEYNFIGFGSNNIQDAQVGVNYKF